MKIQSSKVPKFQICNSFNSQSSKVPNLRTSNLQDSKVSTFQIPKFQLPSFQNPWNTHVPSFSRFEISRFPKTILLIMRLDFLGFLNVSRWFKIKSNWFGESWSRPPGPKSMKMTGVRVFFKLVLKFTDPK